MDFTADEYRDHDGARLAALLSGPPATWVFVGDSITQGVRHTHGSRAYVEQFAEAVRFVQHRLGDAVVNTAVSGWVVDQLLPEFHWRAGRFGPDVVLVMFGTNDCTAGSDAVRHFRFQLDQVVQRARDIGAVPVLQTPPAVLPEARAGSHAAFDDYCEMTREVARDRGTVLVDHARAWEREGGIEQLMDDPTHPNADGHELMARTLLASLGLPTDLTR